MTRKQKDELRTRYLEQLPMVAAVLMDDDPDAAAKEALELLDACANVIEEAEE